MAKSRGRKFAEITSPTSGVFDLTSVPTITNAKLQNSAMTLAGSSVSLGGTGVADTDALSEGSSNLYFTDARVQTFLGGGTLAGNVVVPDNRSIILGSSSDFTMVHSTAGNLTQIVNSTGALQITSNGGFDVTGAATFSSTLASSDATFTASSATAAAVNIKRSSSSGRAQLTLQDEGGNNLWRIGVTGAGATDFAFFDGSDNVLTLSTNNSATFAGTINVDTIQNASGNLNILSTESILLKFDSDSNQTNRELNIQNNASDQILKITETGTVTFSGNMLISDGSVSTPAIGFANDTDTGILRVTTNALGITAAGSRKFYVNATNAYFQNLTQVQIDGGNFYVDGRTGFRTQPDSNYAIKLLQSSSLTHGGYFQINGGTATGLEINATSGSYSGTALFVQQSSVSTGGFLARFANSSGNKVTIETDGTTNFAGNVKASDIIAAGSGGLALQTDEGTKRLFVKDNGDVKVGQLAVGSATSAPLHVAKASTDVQAIFGDNNSSIDDPSIRIIGRNSANSDIRYTFAGLDADANKGFLGYNQGSGGFVNALEFNTSGNVTIANGVSSDTQSRMYVWTALNNSANSGDRFVKICRIVTGQSARVNIELVGRYASYGNGSFGAYGMLVGQCNNDSNFDFVFYDYRNGQTGGQVVMEAGQVNVSSGTVDLYIKISSYSEIVARAMISEGTLTPETGNTGASVGSSSSPSGYINIPHQAVLVEEQNGHLRFTERSRRAELRSDGDFHVAWTGSADTTGYFYAGEDFSATNHRINRAVTQGNTILVVSGYSSSSADSALFYGVSNGGSNTNATAIRTGKNTSTLRSINAAGTINASGTDYAEYMKKKSTAFEIAAGDICGVNENGELTNKFTEAHSFVVKSTDPSYVGGDSWGSEDVIGPKPLLTKQNFADRNNEVPETDEEYAARKEKYESDLAAYEVKLNAERIKYDRIAFSGQVPINITGAKVGDYIIPKEKTGDLITAEAITEPTFVQYQIAVGKVWKILEDGRAFISVKIG